MNTVRRQRKRNAIYSRAISLFGYCPCFVCKLHVYKEDATLEHVVPLSLGGTNGADNLWISHLACNLKRGNKL